MCFLTMSESADSAAGTDLPAIARAQLARLARMPRRANRFMIVPFLHGDGGRGVPSLEGEAPSEPWLHCASAARTEARPPSLMANTIAPSEGFAPPAA